MEKYNVVVSRTGTVVAISQTPLRNGTPTGWRAYQVEASSREDARTRARVRWEANETSDESCWR